VADGVANIRVAECNGSMWGAVSWEKVPGGLDKNNPDASKQRRPTLAMPILLNMKKISPEKWEGEVYNAKDGQNYKSTIRLSDPEHLEIQGCVLGFLCGGETWTRVAGPIPSSPSNMSKAMPGSPKMAPAPKTIGTAVAKPVTAPKAVAGQKSGTPGQPADVGDICLLPDIAGFAH
jgi:hypothetical protein